MAAAASLALASAPGYDPMAWVVWGRELAHLDLSTSGGPSFKPLPVLVTAVLSPAGDLVPDLWLVIVRAGGLLGVLFAFRLAFRFAGVPGGLTAALAAALAAGQAGNALQGYSEPLLIGLVLAAIDMHLSGRWRLAFGLGLLGALVRPELWPLLAAYAAYAWAHDASFRPALAGGLVLVPCLWVGLDWWGSGDFLHGGSVARSTPAASAALTDHPALTVCRRAAELVTAPLLAAAAGAVVVAVRRRIAVVAALGVATLLWVAAVALMAEAGFTGNVRYLAVPAGLLAVLAGVGVGWLVAAFEPGRARRAAAVAAALLVLGLRLRAGTVERPLAERGPRAERPARRAGARRGARGRPVRGARARAARDQPVAADGARLEAPTCRSSRFRPTWGSAPARPHWRPPALVFRAPPRLAGPAPSLRGRQREIRPLRVGRWRLLPVRTTG